MASVVARCGSYGSHNPVRKGGSDEAEAENRDVVMIDMEGCIFFDGVF